MRSTAVTINGMTGAELVRAASGLADGGAVVSKGLAGAVYGIMLILLIYLMPSGLAGLVRLVVMRFAKASR